MLKVLKFSYFLALFTVLSCGEKKGTDQGKATSGTEQVTQEEAQEDKNGVILFFGNSLTAGYGLDTQEAFPALIQNKIDSLGLNYTVVNSGVSGETTSGGKNRLDWVLNQNIEVFVLELGANDGLRGIPLSETRKNLQEIIEAVRKKNADTQIVLAGMQIPPNMGQAYTSEFRSIFPELAEKNEVKLIPFLLEGVAGIPDLNQSDGIHPTAQGQKIVADNVWSILKEVVR